MGADREPLSDGRTTRRRTVAVVVAFAAVLLAGLWTAATLQVSRERALAESAHLRLAADLARVFEARLSVRFDGIDRGLQRLQTVLADSPVALSMRLEALGQGVHDTALLELAVTDATGRVVASTIPASRGGDAGREADFQEHRAAAIAQRSDRLLVSRPARAAGATLSTVRFTRRIETAAGAFAGIVIAVIDPAVLAEVAQDLAIGEQGSVSIVGRDGFVRLLHTRLAPGPGDHAPGGPQMDAARLVDPDRPAIALRPLDVDGRPTLTAYRRMPRLPLVAAVHLSDAERLAPVQERTRFLYAAAALVSLVVLLFSAGLVALIRREFRTRAALAGAIARLRDNEQALEERVRERTRALEQSNRHVHALAYTDPLTTLPNRSLFADRAEHAVRCAARDGRSLALLFVDLDRFKMVNDTLGHAAGDEMLAEVARRVRSVVRAEDTVARMGGDEFVVIAEGLGGAAEAGRTARRLLEAFATPVTVRGQDLHVGLSVGIAVYPEDGRDVSTLLKSADAAMYAAKSAGRNTARFFSASMREAAERRLELEGALRRAVQDGAFTLAFQPKIELASGRLQGVEALLRWQHPERGAISPAEFIPLAEECGLIEPLGAWVLEEACRTIAGWDTARLGPLTVAVNVAAAQVTHGDLAAFIDRLVHHHRIDPGRLEIEVTETAVIGDTTRALATLNRLRSLGVAVALDDFGTGYSSLVHLRQLDIDALKIDRSFIDGVGQGTRNAEIVRLIIRLAKALDLAVVAEGVESAEHVAFLTDAGCDLIQGYLVARPMPLDALVDWVAAHEETRGQAWPPSRRRQAYPKLLTISAAGPAAAQ